MAEHELGVTVGIVNPQSAEHRSRALKATLFKQLRPSAIAGCQLPDVMRDADGNIRKPSTW